MSEIKDISVVLSYFETMFKEEEDHIVFGEELLEYIRCLYDAYLINNYEMMQICEALGISIEVSVEENSPEMQTSFGQALYTYLTESNKELLELEKRLERFTELETNVNGSDIEKLSIDLFAAKEEINRLECDYEDLAQRYDQSIVLLNQIGVEEHELFSVELGTLDEEEIEEWE